MGIDRIKVNANEGLNKEQVHMRVQQKLMNYDTTVPTKTIKQIIWNNLATPFNFLNIFLALAVFFTDSYKNLLFMGVVISNSIISIIQEIRSKKVVDQLSVLATKQVTVIRDGLKQHIDINEIVLDDVLVYQMGNQVITDCTILEGECEVSEAFITGESDAIIKKKGDSVRILGLIDPEVMEYTGEDLVFEKAQMTDDKLVIDQSKYVGTYIPDVDSEQSEFDTVKEVASKGGKVIAQEQDKSIYSQIAKQIGRHR